jgi:hypothetical protein
VAFLSYNLGFATAGLDAGFNFTGENKDKDGNVIGKTATEDGEKGRYKFGIGVWLKKAYGGASIKGGLALSLGENNGKKLVPYSLFPSSLTTPSNPR